MTYSKNLLPYARSMRQEMTPQEKKLWHCFLSKHRPRVMRQRIIGGYIADFYCAAAKLVIEIDGLHHRHSEGMEYDKARTQLLADLGLFVVRINNADIDRNFEAVCQFIAEEIAQHTNESRNPRPLL